MKKILFFLLFAQVAMAQNVAKIDSGSLNGAHYTIFFPDNWKGKLAMFAHGYEFMGGTPLSKNPDLAKRMSPFLERGFAIAASDYRIQGFSMPQGVDDTEDLRQFFVKKYGQPDTTLMLGQSLGGGVALATMENFSQYYQGALAMCPFSSRPYLQCRKEFDIYATFNVLFPNVVPSLSNVMDKNVPYVASNPRELGPKIKAIKDALMKDSLVALQFARRFDMKLTDLPMSLAFNENVLRDIAQKAGGNPFDNTNTLYNGFPNDYELNKKVERLAATVEEDNIFGKYDRTGNIGKPVVLLHTVYDQLIPPQYGVINFDNMVHQKNKEQFLVMKFTNGQAHCQFTPEQVGKSFDDLRAWVKTGVKAKGGAVE